MLLATWATTKGNPYFARNAVNRLAQLVGAGMVEPLGDMGGDATPKFGQTAVAAEHYRAKPSRVFRFEEIREAHRLMDANQANGKMVAVI